MTVERALTEIEEVLGEGITSAIDFSADAEEGVDFAEASVRMVFPDDATVDAIIADRDRVLTNAYRHFDRVPPGRIYVYFTLPSETEAALIEASTEEL